MLIRTQTTVREIEVVPGQADHNCEHCGTGMNWDQAIIGLFEDVLWLRCPACGYHWTRYLNLEAIHVDGDA